MSLERREAFSHHCLVACSHVLLRQVSAILEQLALTGCRGVRIGNALNRGISGAMHNLALHTSILNSHAARGMLLQKVAEFVLYEDASIG